MWIRLGYTPCASFRWSDENWSTECENSKLPNLQYNLNLNQWESLRFSESCSISVNWFKFRVTVAVTLCVDKQEANTSSHRESLLGDSLLMRCEKHLNNNESAPPHATISREQRRRSRHLRKKALGVVTMHIPLLWLQRSRWNAAANWWYFPVS